MTRRPYDDRVILRCTRKLLAIIGPAAAIEPVPAPDPEDWYGNLLWFDRRKCLQHDARARTAAVS
jgi:hypothetical protein